MTSGRRPGPPTKKRLPVNGKALGMLAKAFLPRPSSLARSLPFPLGKPTVPNGVEPQKEKSRTGADFDTEWARRYPARAARVLLVEGIVRPSVTVLAAPILLGTDRLAGLEGPAVFAANHHSHIDTPLLLSVIPEPWRHHMAIGAAADYFFGNRVTGTLSALIIGAITMPCCCFLSAWKKPLRHLFPVPVLAILVGVTLLLAGWRS